MQISFVSVSWKSFPVCNSCNSLFWTHGSEPFSPAHPLWSLNVLTIDIRTTVIRSTLELAIKASLIFIRYFHMPGIKMFEVWKGSSPGQTGRSFFPLLLMGQCIQHIIISIHTMTAVQEDPHSPPTAFRIRQEGYCTSPWEPNVALMIRR